MKEQLELSQHTETEETRLARLEARVLVLETQLTSSLKLIKDVLKLVQSKEAHSKIQVYR